MGSFTKQPTERYPISKDWDGKMPTGLTLVSAVAAVTDEEDDSVVTSTLLVTATCTISGTEAIVTVRAGEDGHTYKITYTATFDDGSILVEEDFMTVEDL